jgi:hypothetical protein
MATGDTLLTLPAAAGIQPSSAFAPLSRRNNHPVALYDAATDENLDFECVMPEHYGGGGLTIDIVWAADTATTGNCIWNIQLERHQAEVSGSDLDTDAFAAANAVTDAAPGTSAGRLAYATITFTDGADMDSIAAGEAFRLRVTRDANNASDTMAGDAQLLTVHVTET